MTNLMIETTKAKEAVLFMCNNLNQVAKQFTDMLQHCKKYNLRVVDMFFDTSGIKSYEEKCFNQLLDYLKRTKTKTAVVFYSRKDFCKFPLTHKLTPFRDADRIELHFAKDKVILGN